MDITKELLEHYIGLNYSVRQISKIVKKNKNTITKYLKRYGLKCNYKRTINKELSQKMNEARWGKYKKIEDYNWIEIQSYYDSGVSTYDIMDKYKFNYGLLRKAQGLNLFKVRTAGETMKLTGRGHRKQSEESKKKISEKRKEWLKNNPDKHPWRKSNKFKSVPCEKLKEFLKLKNIEFIEEYQALRDEGRYYSIDVAFPDKKIGLEVNGNQHYNNDGTLKDYYKERQIFLENAGWKLYQLHYSICFKEGELNKIIPEILSSQIKIEFNYQTYIKPERKKKIRVSDTNPNWKHDPRPSQYKIKRPSKEELEKMIWVEPVTKVAKIFGMSDSGIKKWCQQYKIKTPPRGYWRRLKSGETKEQILSTPSKEQIKKENTDIEYWNRIAEKRSKSLELYANTDLSLREIEEITQYNRGSISEQLNLNLCRILALYYPNYVKELNNQTSFEDISI